MPTTSAPASTLSARPFRQLPLLLLAACVVLGASGCAQVYSRVYYDTLEKFGFAKREVLADRIDATRKAQQAAKTQFADALQRFLAVTKADGGTLKRKYDELNTQFQRSDAKAKEVRARIDAVKDVADALFREWQKELSQYSNADLRRDSERQLDATRRKYDALLALMERAADRMDPILVTFRDQVLYLKHNLNAAAVASLANTQRLLEDDTTRLIAEMENSIREAEAFIKTLKSGS